MGVDSAKPKCSKYTDPECVISTAFISVLFGGASFLENITSVASFDFANYVEVCCLSANRRVQRRPQAEDLYFFFHKDPLFSLKMLQHL